MAGRSKWIQSELITLEEWLTDFHTLHLISHNSSSKHVHFSYKILVLTQNLNCGHVFLIQLNTGGNFARAARRSRNEESDPWALITSYIKHLRERKRKLSDTRLCRQKVFKNLGQQMTYKLIFQM